MRRPVFISMLIASLALACGVAMAYEDSMPDDQPNRGPRAAYCDAFAAQVATALGMPLSRTTGQVYIFRPPEHNQIVVLHCWGERMRDAMLDGHIVWMRDAIALVGNGDGGNEDVKRWMRIIGPLWGERPDIAAGSIGRCDHVYQTRRWIIATVGTPALFVRCGKHFGGVAYWLSPNDPLP
jgi:hypothetical protein